MYAIDMILQLTILIKYKIAPYIGVRFLNLEMWKLLSHILALFYL
jgi:hypothetical protein